MLNRLFTSLITSPVDEWFRLLVSVLVTGCTVNFEERIIAQGEGVPFPLASIMTKMQHSLELFI